MNSQKKFWAPRFGAIRLRGAVARIGVAMIFAAAGVVITNCGGGADKTGPTTLSPLATVQVTAPVTTLSPTQTVQLSATAKRTDGSAAAVSFSFVSSNTAVATVNGSGLVTAIAPGTASMTVSADGKIAVIAITVVAAGGTVTAVNVTLSDAALPIGSLGQGTVVARDANNAVIALGTRTITWSSTNTAAATVSSAGVISTVGIGSAQIRASVVEGSNTIVGASTLTVVANPDAKQSVDISMPGLTFSPADVVVKVGGTVRYIFPSLDHNVIFSPRLSGSPTDIPILANQTVSRTFPTAGVFPFVCTLHNGMVGTVVVSP